MTGASGTPPLDLRAVERDLYQTWPDNAGLSVLYARSVALLAHCRALRAALLYARQCILTEASGAGPTPDFGKIDAVLRAARDGPA